MDYILPDEVTMEKMSSEYARLIAETKHNGNAAAALSEQPVADTRALTRAQLLVLYFVFVLGYNLGYGTSIHDPDRGMGGLQSRQGAAGDVDNFFRRKG